jgi:type II secretory ATPase GspE/PulE/Tfp pilus assembly ATPase PilB-like protein
MADKITFEPQKKTPEMDARLKSNVDERGVIQEVDTIIADAIESGATEIHFEPGLEGYTIRRREGSFLKEVGKVEDKLKGNVANRLKVLGGMDITKNKIPQSGFFKSQKGEKKLELYVHLLPTLYGEVIIIKISYKQSATMRLSQLGINPSVLTEYSKALAKGSGLYLITGPPGSGKRTTVYASILEIYKPNLLTLAYDPVIKYEVPGMVQGKPEERSEFTFGEAISALMKQEPDIAYIGDITCENEARVTIQGAFAKRVVLARMTANDTVNAIQNLVDMGIQPFLLAASLTATINQRLIRKLCPACREAYPVDNAIQIELGYRLPENSRFFKAKGCPQCENTGYSGVVAIFELYRPSEELNKMVVAKESIHAVRAQAYKEGLISLKKDGISKALMGLATLEDVLNSL